MTVPSSSRGALILTPMMEIGISSSSTIHVALWSYPPEQCVPCTFSQSACNPLHDEAPEVGCDSQMVLGSPSMQVM